MRMDVTRDVISDLWPLCRSGEASADSRALVDTFLAADTSFASTMREASSLPGALPDIRLSPDAERRLLNEARDRARLKLVMIGAAIGLAGLLALAALAGAMVLVFRGA